jgi:predicted transcriptional regulator
MIRISTPLNNQSMMEKLTPQEEELMLIIWQQNGGITKSFISKMKEPDTPYTTVASIVRNLERKGYVSSKLYGNTYEYKPKIDESDYKAMFMSSVVNNYFENSYKEMVSFFAKKQKISAEELQEIIQLIEQNNE